MQHLFRKNEIHPMQNKTKKNWISIFPFWSWFSRWLIDGYLWWKALYAIFCFHCRYLITFHCCWVFFYPEIEFCKVGVIVGAISQSPFYRFSCTLDILLDWCSSTLVSNSNWFESIDIHANFLYWGIMEKKSLW